MVCGLTNRSRAHTQSSLHHKVVYSIYFAIPSPLWLPLPQAGRSGGPMVYSARGPLNGPQYQRYSPRGQGRQGSARPACNNLSNYLLYDASLFATKLRLDRRPSLPCPALLVRHSRPYRRALELLLLSAHCAYCYSGRGFWSSPPVARSSWFSWVHAPPG